MNKPKENLWNENTWEPLESLLDSGNFETNFIFEDKAYWISIVIDWDDVKLLVSDEMWVHIWNILYDRRNRTESLGNRNVNPVLWFVLSNLNLENNKKIFETILIELLDN